MNEWNIGENITIAEVDKFPVGLYNAQARSYLMKDYPMLPWRKHLTVNELDKVELLKTNVQGKYELRLALLKDDELIGWTYGWQDSFDYASFFMGASVVLPHYRNRGLYTQLVQKVIEITDKLGFQSIWSTHIMMNNPVIVAKLKLKFHINGFESNVNYGNLVKLAYHHNDLKNRVANYRAGAIADDEIRDIILGK
jgi:GNAT superfamily N-acetyltransferase